MANWLVPRTPDLTVAGSSFSTLSLSTQGTKKVASGESPCDGLATHPGGIMNTLSRFMLGKLR